MHRMHRPHDVGSHPYQYAFRSVLLYLGLFGTGQVTQAPVAQPGIVFPYVRRARRTRARVEEAE